MALTKQQTLQMQTVSGTGSGGPGAIGKQFRERGQAREAVPGMGSEGPRCHRERGREARGTIGKNSGKGIWGKTPVLERWGLTRGNEPNKA